MAGLKESFSAIGLYGRRRGIRVFGFTPHQYKLPGSDRVYENREYVSYLYDDGKSSGKSRI